MVRALLFINCVKGTDCDNPEIRCEKQSAEAKNKKSKGTVKTASPIFFFAFALVIFFTTWPKFKPGYESKQWPATKGIILQAEAQKVIQDDDESYEPVLSYSYEVDGIKRISSRITFNSRLISFKSRLEANAFLSKYPVNSEIIVRYDPQKPDEAVLIPGYEKSYLFSLVLVLVFVIWGLSILKTTRKLTVGINTENKLPSAPVAD